MCCHDYDFNQLAIHLQSSVSRGGNSSGSEGTESAAFSRHPVLHSLFDEFSSCWIFLFWVKNNLLNTMCFFIRLKKSYLRLLTNTAHVLILYFFLL